MWGSLFGGGAAAAKKKQDAAKNSIVKLREQVNMLEKKEAHLQKQIDELTATAKRNVQTNKKGASPFPPAALACQCDAGRRWMLTGRLAALVALKRKKALEHDLDKWSATKNTLEQQVFSLENANINLETMKAMQQGAKAMKGIHGDLYPPPPPSSPVCANDRAKITGKSGYHYGRHSRTNVDFKRYQRCHRSACARHRTR